jgi:hypothetical protein
MKPFLLFLVTFSALAYFFGSEDVQRYETIQAISVSPAFASASVAEVVKVSGRKRLFRDPSESYFVRYNYVVDGVGHEIHTTHTDQGGVARYLSDPKPQVAYSTRDPKVATLKRYYDLSRKDETLFQVLVVVGLLSFVVALPISLLLSWRFGWFKRRLATP